MQKGQTLIFIILALVAAAFVATMFYVGKQTPTPPAQEIGSTPSPTPSPSPVDETLTWKTYTNTDYGYSLNYPSAWKIEIPSNTSGVGKLTVYVSVVSDTQFKNDSGCCFPYAVGINVYENSQNKTIQQLGNELSNNFTYAEETLNGIKIYRTDSLSSQFGSEAVFFKSNNGNYVSLSLNPFSKTKSFVDQDNQHKIFNKILSTFKFTQ